MPTGSVTGDGDGFRYTEHGGVPRGRKRAVMPKLTRKIRVVGPDVNPSTGTHLVRRVKNPAAVVEEQATPGTIEVSGFISEGAFLHLKKPLKVKVYRQNGSWVHEYEPLNLLGHGNTIEDSRQELLDFFLSLWRNYALEDDRNLTAGAQALKLQLLALVETVDQIA